MVVNKRRKNSRQHGGNTHGWGSMKKHRGKGNKGGAGMAGTGKRGNSKVPSIWKIPYYFGKRGFKVKGAAPKDVVCNVGDLKLDRLLAEKKVVLESDTFIIDLAALGYDKLLGGGIVTRKMKVTAPKATESAIKKVKEAGGEVIIKEE